MRFVFIRVLVMIIMRTHRFRTFVFMYVNGRK